MKKIIVFSLIILGFSSCISRKQLTYLQKEDANQDKIYQPLFGEPYKVQFNDILSVTIKAEDERASEAFDVMQALGNNIPQGDLLFYLRGFPVDGEGMIELPMIGKIKVLDQSISKIEEMIRKELATYFKEGAIFVKVSFSGIRFNIVGEVNAPGRYILYQNQINIFEAVAVAGDITMVGNRKEVQLIRQTTDGIEIHDLDLTNSEILASPYYFIQPNDIINVKPLGVKSIGIGQSGFQTFAAILGVVASTATLIFTLSNIN